MPSKLKHMFHRTKALCLHAVDLWPWTLLGMVLAVVAAACLWFYGYAKIDLVLLVFGFGASGVWMLATLLVVVVALAMKWRLFRNVVSAETQRVTETGRFIATGFSLSTFRWLPLVQVRWGWSEPTNVNVQNVGKSGRFVEEVEPSRRGTIDKVSRRVIVSDTFGICKISLRSSGRVELKVLPHLGALGRIPQLTSLSGGDEIPHPMGIEDGDRVELRRYVPGDPARFINWKVFGRTRKLMVRMPERALMHARRTVAYLVSAEGDEASAAVARAVIERRSLGEDWQFGADGTYGATSDSDEALDRIVESGDRKGEGGLGLASFARLTEAQGPATLMVFVPAKVGDWLLAVREVVAARRGRLSFVVGVDARATPDEPSFWRRLMYKTFPAEEGAKELDEVLRVLSKMSSDVVIVDRVGGQLHNAAARSVVQRARQEAA